MCRFGPRGDGYVWDVHAISYEELLGSSGEWCVACGYPAVDTFMIVRVADGVPSDATSLTICQECGSTLGPDGNQPRLNFD